MLHRRTLYDDALGVGEPLNETAYGQGLVVRGRHFLLLDTPSNSALGHRFLAQHLYMNPLTSFALTSAPYEVYSTNYSQSWSALDKDWPLNVHLLTFDQLHEKEYLVRLEHYFELNEDATYSQSVIVDLQDLFKQRGTISDVLELTLAANLPLNELNRLEWLSKEKQPASKVSRPAKVNAASILLKPMQIRTFRITLE